jgi:RNA polymerase sigma-70 factor, ECF subfamily
MEPVVRPYNTNGPVPAARRAPASGKRSEMDKRSVVPQSRSEQGEPRKTAATAKRARTATPVVEWPREETPVQPETPLALPVEAIEQEAEHVAEAGPVVGLADFEDIFTRFQTPLTNFVYRLVGNREQAYDLTQDVFVKAFRALSAGTTIQAAALSSWLYRIASNTATDALRRRRLINWLPLSLFNEDRGVGAGMPGADNVTQQATAEENLAATAMNFVGGYDGGRFEQRVADREVVERVLRRLPSKYATCLLLYEHEGFSCAEIAEVLKVSPSAVKMRLMRARERFIALYKQETGGLE